MKKIISVKLLLYVVAGFLGGGLGLLLIVFIGRGQNPENSPPMMIALILLFAIAPLGGLWMIKTAFRGEKNPWPLILLAAFIPFAFLWYYFERVRPRKEIDESGMGG